MITENNQKAVEAPTRPYLTPVNFWSRMVATFRCRLQLKLARYLTKLTSLCSWRCVESKFGVRISCRGLWERGEKRRDEKSKMELKYGKK